jgi:hypothetical protein
MEAVIEYTGPTLPYVIYFHDTNRLVTVYLEFNKRPCRSSPQNKEYAAVDAVLMGYSRWLRANNRNAVT